MKIKVKDLLALERKECGFYLVEELDTLLKLNNPTNLQILPEIPDELENRDLVIRGSDVSLNYKHYEYSYAVDSCGNNRDRIECMLENAAIDNVIQDTSTYAVFVDFYDDKPIIIKLWDISLHTTKMYFMNKDYLQKFRNDWLFKAYASFIPHKINMNDIFIPEENYLHYINRRDGMENFIGKTVEEIVNTHPYAIFTSKNIHSMSDIIEKVFVDKSFNKTACIPDAVIHSIVGYPVAGDTDKNYFQPLPIEKVDRLSLVLLTEYKDDETHSWEDMCTLWMLQVDGENTLLWYMEDGYFVETDYVYMINESKFTELQSIIAEIYTPKFYDIPDSEFVTEDDEIEIVDTEFISHEIDGRIKCTINTSLYIK